MAKKNKKKYSDIWWDITAEEQMEIADKMYLEEKGEKVEVDVFDLHGKIPKKKYAKSGLPTDVEEIIIDRHQSDTKIKVPDAVTDINNFDEMVLTHDEYPASSDDAAQPPKSREENSTVKDNYEITVQYNPDLDIIYIDDIITRRSMRCFTAELFDVNTSVLDSNEICSTITSLHFFIISSLYPTAIFTKEEFNKEYSCFEKYNMQKYVFFQQLDYVFAYMLQDNFLDEISNIISSHMQYFESDAARDNYLICFMVALANTVDETAYFFPSDDAEYIEHYMKYQDNLSAKKALYDNISSNPDTTWKVSIGDADCTNFNIINLTKFRTHVLDMIHDIDPNNSPDDEDDEDDGFDYEEDFLKSAENEESMTGVSAEDNHSDIDSMVEVVRNRRC